MKKYLISALAVGFTLGAIFFSATPVSAQVAGSLWKLTANYLYPVNSLWGVAVPSLANNPCIGTDSSGKFEPGTCSGGTGTVTQINTTYPITGGPITTTGTIGLSGYATTTLVAGTNITLSGTPVILGATPITINATGGGGSGLSTTSPLASSNLLVYSTSGAGSAYGVATSTLSASSPLTGSFVQVGSGGSLGCQTASGSQAGCLSSTDWTTFNSKGSGTVTSIATNNGLTGGTITTTGTIGLAAIAANSVLGNITGASGVPSAIATSSLFFNAGASTSGLLTSTDWNTFNGKQPALSLLAGTYTNGDMCTYASSGTLLNCNTAIPTGTVTSVGLSSTNSTLTIGSTPVTTSGTITADLNLSHSNAWAALQTFALSSTTLASVTSKLYIGGTSTTTIDSAGNIVVPSGANITDTTLGTAAGTFVAANASGQLIATTSPTGSNYFTNSGIYTYLSTGTNIGIGSTTPSALLSLLATSTTAVARLFEIDTATSSTIASTSVYIANSTWAPPYNLVSATITTIAAGGAGGSTGSSGHSGGGGGSTAVSTSTVLIGAGGGGGGGFVPGRSAGGGGGGGGYASATFTAAAINGATLTITVGQGGLAAGTGGTGYFSGGTGDTGSVGNGGGGGGLTGAGAAGATGVGGAACGGGGGGTNPLSNPIANGNGSVTAGSGGEGGQSDSNAGRGGGGTTVGNSNVGLVGGAGSAGNNGGNGGNGGSGTTGFGAGGGGGGCGEIGTASPQQYGGGGGGSGSSGAGSGGSGSGTFSSTYGMGGNAATNGSPGVVIISSILSGTSTSPVAALTVAYITAVTGATTTPAVGVGTSTPSATFAVQSNWGDITEMVSSFIGTIDYVFQEIDQFGHLITGGPAPSCGTGCASVTGDDRTMNVVTGSSVTSVTVNFANTYTKTPICLANEDASAGAVAVGASTTPSTVVLTLASSLTTKNVGVICQISNNFTF